MRKNSIQVIDKISKLPVNHINAAGDSLKMLAGAYLKYKETSEIEKTKRAAISAWRDTKVLELNNQKEILELYLKESFKERALNIEGFFETLDKGIASGNDDLIKQSIGAILSIANESPISNAANLMAAMRNPDIKEIEI